MNRDLSQIVVRADATVREILALINENSTGFALVVDSENRPVRAMTDGDLRRALLAGVSLDSRIGGLKPSAPPILCTYTAAPAEQLRLMRQHKIQQLPLVDEEGRVVHVVILSDLIEENAVPLNAVVMAGGFGSRLAPLTADTPKPMLPVGDKPLLEHIVGQLRTAGIGDVSITTHYLAERIHDHFGDGDRFGLSINYIHESEPLGTAGALRLIARPTGPLLVMNGDILTNVDFRKLHLYHDEHEADLTMAVRPFETYIPYGVVETEKGVVKSLREKPTFTHFVNAGIYLLSPSAFDYLESDGRLDMTHLIDRLIEAGKTVASFPLAEYWLDIGHLHDYERAQSDVAKGRMLQ